jgi:hypothetical protein
MAAISEQERLRRRNANANVIGTNAMEGLTLDSETLALMRRFEDGELDREQLSSAIDHHVEDMLNKRVRAHDELVSAIAGAA